MIHLFTVADTFQIEKRGLVLVPGLPTEPESPNVKVGARVRLRRPDGEELDTEIRAIEMISYRQKPEKINCPILLQEKYQKADIPIGTEVYLLEEDYKTIRETKAEQGAALNSRHAGVSRCMLHQSRQRTGTPVADSSGWRE